MKIAVYDTYVERKDGMLMHFDILVPAEQKELEQIYTYGRTFLSLKGQEGQTLTSHECRFCHIEEPGENVISDIRSQGFSIIEMEGCKV